MAKTRTGARTFLFLMQKCCHLSHMAGFRGGLTTILGPDSAADFYALWTPACTMLESIIALDDWFNKRDATLPDSDGSEDGPFG
jgi:hypothetical protein